VGHRRVILAHVQGGGGGGGGGKVVMACEMLSSRMMCSRATRDC